ncbi:hypothetical protein ACOMHN_008183 [Nucella lapillus]
MAAQSQPKVRKTKKSSYKPLSQLNEDRLTELSRMDKPENARRVFYCGLAHKARLRTNVNVWFRHHRHSLTLLQRQQRAVQHQMGRLQHDVRRVRREDYKRRQEEIRTTLTALQMRLLQRRVVDRFQQNAMSKMAARGEQSLLTLRKTGNHPGHVTAHQLISGACAPTLPTGPGSGGGAVGQPRLGSGSDRGADPQDPPASSHKVPTHSERRKSELSSNSKKGDDRGAAAARHTSGHCPSDSGSRKAQTQKQKSVRRFSEGDVGKEADVGVTSLSTLTAPSKDIPNPLTPNKPSLDIIPEDTPGTKNPDGNDPEGRLLSLQSPKGPVKAAGKEIPPGLNSRVLEVRKHRPHSPTTRQITGSRRATLGTLPQISKLKTASLNTPQTSDHDQDGEDPKPGPMSSPSPQGPSRMHNFQQDSAEIESHSQNDTKPITDTEKDRQAERNTEKDRQAERNTEKDRQAERKTEKDRQAERNTEKDRQAERNTEKDRQAERNTEKDRQAERNTEKDRQAERNTEKDRQAERNTEAHADRAAEGASGWAPGELSHVPSHAQVMQDAGVVLGEEGGRRAVRRGDGQRPQGLPRMATRLIVGSYPRIS